MPTLARLALLLGLGRALALHGSGLAPCRGGGLAPRRALPAPRGAVHALAEEEEAVAAEAAQKPPPSLPGPVDQLPGAAALALAFEENPQLELAGCAIVFCSAIAFAIETLPLPEATNLAFSQFDSFVSVTFAIEYAMRWYSANLSPRYIVQPLAVVDLLSWLPLVLQMAVGADASLGGGLAFLRLLRVLRLQRFVRSYEAFSTLQRSLGIEPDTEVKPYQLEVARVVSSIFTLLFVSTGLIYQTEHQVNAAIPDFFTALYFGLTTLTTVGFGDIVPITPEGRLVVCASILAGVAVIPIQLASLGEALVSSGTLGKAGSAGGLGEAAGALLGAPPAGAPPAGALPRAGACATCGEAAHLGRAVFCHRCGSVLEVERPLAGGRREREGSQAE